MSWSTSELRVRLAPWNWFNLIKYFYWPSKAVLFCGFLSCVCYAFVRICLFLPYGHLLGKDWLIGSRLWCLIVSLLLSHWYPGSGVVLDCIDPWSLPSFLLAKALIRLVWAFAGCKYHNKWNLMFGSQTYTQTCLLLGNLLLKNVWLLQNLSNSEESGHLVLTDTCH